MSEVLLTGLVLGALGGGYVGHWLGWERAARHAGKNTYRSVRRG